MWIRYFQKVVLHEVGAGKRVIQQTILCRLCVIETQNQWRILIRIPIMRFSHCNEEQFEINCKRLISITDELYQSRYLTSMFRKHVYDYLFTASKMWRPINKKNGFGTKEKECGRPTNSMVVFAEFVYNGIPGLFSVK